MTDFSGAKGTYKLVFERAQTIKWSVILDNTADSTTAKGFDIGDGGVEMKME